MLGYVASPLLLLSLFIIVLRGIITAQRPVETSLTLTEIFTHNIIQGISHLRSSGKHIFYRNYFAHFTQHLWWTRGNDAALLWTAHYVRWWYLHCPFKPCVRRYLLYSMYHGHGLAGAHEGELFQEVSYTVFPHGSGSFVIVTAVLTACLCTAVALTTIFTEYLQTHLTKNRISYETALALSLLLCLPLSTFGLQTILGLSQGPLTYIGYPVIITLTFCNIAYMTVGFKPVKVPVLFTFVVALLCYLWR